MLPLAPYAANVPNPGFPVAAVTAALTKPGTAYLPYSHTFFAPSVIYPLI